LGNKQRLNDQVHQSLRLTMRGRQLADGEVDDMIEFLKTLKPPPPFQPVTSADDRAAVAQGRELFEALNCSSCHEGRTLTSEDVYDVGLTDDLGAKEFNPPSLRGVGHRYGLFHDKRAANVEQVVRHFKHQLPRALSVREQQTLIRYLNSL
jgi:cytochrome c peroxidase